MRYGLISDIHSNMEALNAVIDSLEKSKTDSYLCCGDIIGYGPNPNECIAKVRSLKNVRMVLGNHDAACCGLKELTWFNEYAQTAILWTRNRLSPENCEFMKSLPKIYSENSFTMVHGSPRDPLSEYLLTKMQFTENTDMFDTQICFTGHSHIPVVYRRSMQSGQDEFVKVVIGAAVKIEKEYKYIINAGGVGQPRDSDIRASCAVYDEERQEVLFNRVEYDFRVTQEKMKQEGLPRFLIERLGRGA